MTRAFVVWLVLAGPPAAATAALTYVTAVEGRGGSVFPGSGAANSAEAAALGDAATMLRLLRLGDDPNRVHPIRSWIISSSVRQATTLEAAMWSRRVEVIRALDREGVIGHSDTRAELACLAKDLELNDVFAYLAPAGADCVPGRAEQRVLGRNHPLQGRSGA